MKAQLNDQTERNLDPNPFGTLACGMANATRKGTKTPKSLMLGVGLDSDGHKRITTGPNFALVGGSEGTHEQMTETAIKINEKLKSRGKQLEQVSHEEFDDIAHEAGLKRLDSKANQP